MFLPTPILQQRPSPLQQERLMLLGKYEELDRQLTQGSKHDPSSGAVGPYGHGPGGLFNLPQTDHRIFSAMMYPDTGSLGDIPVMQSAPGQENGDFGGVERVFNTLITGVTAGALDDPLQQPTADCAVGPTPGLTKLGTVVNTYGRYRGSTTPVSMVRAGMRSDVLDPIALQLMNPPSSSNAFWPTLPAGGSILINELSRRLWELVISFQRMLSAQVWTGNPALNNNQRRFIWGLNSQINTNTHVDFQQMAILTAANPFISNFQYGLVNGTANIVQHLEEMDAHLQYRAERHRMTPFSYRLRMRPELFREITAVYPIKAYFEAFNNVSNFTNGRVVVNAADALNVRDDLRRRRMLPINGRFIGVTLDDSIEEQNPTNNAALTRSGTYASDIYATPDAVLGNIPPLFFDYFNHNNANSMSIGQLAGNVTTFTSDGGLFRWYIDFQRGCIQLTFDMLIRLNLLTPQLSGRLLNVAYSPLQHFNTMQPGTAYFANGGVTQQPLPAQLYTGWSPTVPTNTSWNSSGW